MLISKIHLPRRTVLKALGATVGLPLLDAMVPAGTALGRSAAAPRPCMSFVYFPHGALMDQWTPSKEGARLDAQLPSILAPLGHVREQLTVVSGLENKSAIAPPVHAITPATWLSCTAPQSGEQVRAGVTVDQIAASRLGQDTRFDSIQVATQVQGGAGACDRAYGEAYARTLSFQTPSTPLAMEHDPRKVFAKLFDSRDAYGQRSNGSVLDLVRHDAADLSRKLGPRDRAVLEDYLANVRAIECRVQAYDASTAFNEHVQLMFDLIALAYEANVTRVSSFMMAAEVSEQTYDFIGIPESFHALSHHGDSPAKRERLARVQACNTGMFARFVDKLAATHDGEGSLLDHSLIVYGSNMSNSNVHDHSDLPMALVGGACGKLAGNRHVRCPERTPLANLHVAMLNKVGIPTNVFGDSTGELMI